MPDTEIMNEFQKFLDDLMKHILGGTKIPKVQLERAINPILSFFIESILENILKRPQNSIKLISPEFPLKKETNNQSTNVDFLLFDKLNASLIFFELKTDSSSGNTDQVTTYCFYKEIIKRNSANYLRKDLIQISKKSGKKSKYNYIINNFDSVLSNPNKVFNLEIIYLVPQQIKNNILRFSEVDRVLSFNELPLTINDPYSQYWEIIQSNLKQLDGESKTSKEVMNDNIWDNIIINVKGYISLNKLSTHPNSIKIGILGDGRQPNYQVKFNDGSYKTFYFSGKPNRFNKFKSSNLRKNIFGKT